MLSSTLSSAVAVFVGMIQSHGLACAWNTGTPAPGVLNLPWLHDSQYGFRNVEPSLRLRVWPRPSFSSSNSILRVGFTSSRMTRVNETVSASLPDASFASYLYSHSERMSRVAVSLPVMRSTALLLLLTFLTVFSHSMLPSWWSCAEHSGSGHCSIVEKTGQFFEAVNLWSTVSPARVSEITGGVVSCAAKAPA